VSERWREGEKERRREGMNEGMNDWRRKGMNRKMCFYPIIKPKKSK
jgi:hypothetical protein